MKYERKTILGDVNILKNDHYAGRPLTVDFTGITEGAVAAGTPMAANGTVATTTEGVSNVVGVLLSDVYADRPIGTIVVHGFIDVQAAEGHSHVTIDDATKAALPMIAFLEGDEK